MKRASPVQQRAALEIANLFVKLGVGFVPMPVADSAEYEKLSMQSIDKLAEMQRNADAARLPGTNGSGVGNGR